MKKALVGAWLCHRLDDGTVVRRLYRLLRSDADVIGAGRRVGRIDDLRYDGNPARQADISRRDIHARGR